MKTHINNDDKTIIANHRRHTNETPILHSHNPSLTTSDNNRLFYMVVCVVLQ